MTKLFLIVRYKFGYTVPNTCCIQAGTAEHVDNYFNYLWVYRTPLPMGLHCQNPLVIGERSSKGP